LFPGFLRCALHSLAHERLAAMHQSNLQMKSELALVSMGGCQQLVLTMAQALAGGGKRGEWLAL
jgi:hypothetical protein